MCKCFAQLRHSSVDGCIEPTIPTTESFERIKTAPTRISEESVWLSCYPTVPAASFCACPTPLLSYFRCQVHTTVRATGSSGGDSWQRMLSRAAERQKTMQQPLEGQGEANAFEESASSSCTPPNPTCSSLRSPIKLSASARKRKQSAIYKAPEEPPTRATNSDYPLDSAMERWLRTKLATMLPATKI